MIRPSSEKGAAALEAALVLPLILAITFGLIEFGLLMYNKQVITNAAREGARRGIVQAVPRIPYSNGTDGIADVVHLYADRHLVTFASAKPVPDVTVPAICNTFEDNLNVTVSYPYRFLVASNFIPGLSNTMTLTSVSVMRCE
jgi:Flp pilus assembly protein TadG